MKKQLMIAAVAASMSLSAMADISISGTSSATFTSTGSATTNSLAADATIVGTGGGATVTATIDLTDGTIADGASLAMNVMGVDVTTDGTTLTAAMTMGAYTVSYSDGATSSVTLGVDMGGMSASHKMPNAGDATTSVSGSLGGIAVSYSKKGADSNVSVSGGMGGITGTYSDTNHGDDDDLGTVASATMDLGGNSVTLKRFDNTGGVITTSASVATALAGGADLTATWSNNGTADTLKLEVAVSF